jgi:hypothetical protein
MIFVLDAAKFPGPVLWQGIMMLAMPLVLWGMFYKDGKYLKWALGAYVAFGVALLAAVIHLVK